jgi:hypothetical protein
MDRSNHTGIPDRALVDAGYIGVRARADDTHGIHVGNS